MKPIDPLSPVLREWEHRVQNDPTFCPCVWARIRRGSSSSQVVSLSAWQRLSVGWAAAIAVVAASLLGGSAAYAYDQMTRNERQAVAYFRTIDPVHLSLQHHVHSAR